MITSTYKLYGILVVGLLIYFGIRVHNIDSIPLFIDESISVQRSVDIVNGTYLKHASTGKLLLPYFSVIYQPQLNTVFVVRLSLMIFTCLGVTATASIAKRYGGLLAVLIVIALMTFSPMLFFFDRFALTDTLLQTTLTLWLFTHVATFSRRTPSLVWALICGCTFVVAMLTKASALFLIPLPIIFALILARWTISKRIQILSMLYAPIAILWIPLTLVLTRQQINYFGKSDHIAPSANELFDLERISYNFSIMWGGISNYHGMVFLGFALFIIIIGFRAKWRILLVLLAGFLGYGVALIWLGGYGLFIRYTVPMLPMLFMAMAIAAANISIINKKLIYLLSAGLLLIWCIVVSLPFMQTIYDAPQLAPLTHEDRNEYINNNSSGYGIPDLVNYLEALPSDISITVEGAFVSCLTLQFYATDVDHLTIQCPNVLSGDRRAPYLNAYLPSQAETIEHYYLVFETNGLVNQEEITSIDMILEESFAKPNDNNINLYRVIGN